jgi:hypothetical protein
VRIDGTVRDCATLKAIGIRRDDGKRMIFGVSCALSEAEIHWREFLVALKERGIGIPDIIDSDAHTGASRPPCGPPATPVPGSAASSTSSRTPATSSPPSLSKSPKPGNSVNPT